MIRLLLPRQLFLSEGQSTMRAPAAPRCAEHNARGLRAAAAKKAFALCPMDGCGPTDAAYCCEQKAEVPAPPNQPRPTRPAATPPRRPGSLAAMHQPTAPRVGGCPQDSWYSS